jgi:hypothetical protein
MMRGGVWRDIRGARRAQTDDDDGGGDDDRLLGALDS